ncbi:MAG: ferrous iron transport protein A [Rhodothermales bacterium]|jgi:ferrous iron transport protein A
MTTSITLDQLRPGDAFVIRGILGSSKIAGRLKALGFMADTPAKVLGKAPMGCPMQVKIRGTSYAVRRSEATLVEVDA